MAAMLNTVDPDGLLEFTVVFTDRSLNHMSKQFQQVMRDISSMLKEVPIGRIPQSKLIKTISPVQSQGCSQLIHPTSTYLETCWGRHSKLILGRVLRIPE